MLDNTLDLNDEFTQIISDIIDNPTVNQMRNFPHHYTTTCYSHCLGVSYYSYKICKKFGWDYVSAARAGMLHDLFLYNWREKREDTKGLHGFTHPKIALHNSKKIFDINKKEEDIILKHMWPLTLKFPKYKESYVITFIDKYCALAESFLPLLRNVKMKKLYKYVYVFSCFLVFKIV